jgi:hypothetical protein
MKNKAIGKPTAHRYRRISFFLRLEARIKRLELILGEAPLEAGSGNSMDHVNLTPGSKA